MSINRTKLVSIFCLVCLISFNVKAQLLQFKKYEIKKEGYIVHQFGKLNKQNEQNVILILENIGHKPLVIKDLELSCDCLSIKKLTQKKIPPAGSTKIKICYKAKYIGSFDLFAQLKTNALNYPDLWIKLEGEVIEKN